MCCKDIYSSYSLTHVEWRRTMRKRYGHYAWLLIIILTGLLWATAGAQTIRVDDRRINDEDYGTAIGAQTLPDIASSEGGFTAVWESQRPDFKKDVVARLFDRTGSPISGNIIVNGDTGITTVIARPRIARAFPSGGIGNPMGHFAVVWEDWEKGTAEDVFFRLYQNDGKPVLNPVVANDGNGTASEPSIAMAPDSKGSSVMAWTGRNQNTSDIYVRLFNTNGVPSSTSFKVNTDTSAPNQSKPDVAQGGPLNHIVVVWEESDGYVRGIRRIYGQILRSDGRPIGQNFRIDSLVREAYTPRIAMTPDGSFAVAYMTVVNAQQRIMIQRMDERGRLLGGPLLVDSSSKLHHRHPDFAWLPSRGFVVTWSAVPENEPEGNIRFRLFDPDGFPTSKVQQANTSTARRGTYPAIASIGFGNTTPSSSRLFFAWQDDPNEDYDYDIEGRIVEEKTPTGEQFRVNAAETGGANQVTPAIDATASGYHLVVWSDKRGGTAQIYGKRIDNSGTALSSDFIIDNTLIKEDQIDPDIALFPDSVGVVVWTDYRGRYNGDIRLQLIAPSGEQIDQSILVNDSNLTGVRREPAVAIAPNNRFAVVWIDHRSSDSGQTYIQWFDKTGKRLGGNMRVDTDTTNSWHSNPAIAVGGNGSTTVVWSDGRTKTRAKDIWGQQYNRLGKKNGLNFQVNSRNPGDIADRVLPAIDIAPGGATMIAWIDYAMAENRWNEGGDIYARRYTPDGGISQVFQVNNRSQTAEPYCPECRQGSPSVAAAKRTNETKQDNSFVIAWTDYRNNENDADIYTQYYDGNGSQEGSNVQISSAPVNTWQDFPDIARNGHSDNGVLYVWDDTRALASEGQSIWGQIDEWQLGTSSVKNTSTASSNASLLVSPSPATDRVRISFTTKRSEQISLVLHTSDGRLVKTIVEDAYFNQGSQQIMLNLSTFPPGVYICILSTGNRVESKKLIVTGQ